MRTNVRIRIHDLLGKGLKKLMFLRTRDMKTRTFSCLQRGYSVVKEQRKKTRLTYGNMPGRRA